MPPSPEGGILRYNGEMGGLIQEYEQEKHSTKIAIPMLGAELALPEELPESKFIGIALTEMLGGSETMFPTKNLPVKRKSVANNGDELFEQESWISDLTNRLLPKTDAVTSTLKFPEPQDWRKKVAEALSAQPPKTIVLDFEDIEPIHWQDFPSEPGLGINALITIRNILQFLAPLQKLADADTDLIKLKVNLHLNTHAGLSLSPENNLLIQKADQQFRQVFELLKTKLGIHIGTEIISPQNTPTEVNVAQQQIETFWKASSRLHEKLSSGLVGNTPLEKWQSFRSSCKQAPKAIGSLIYGYDLALADLLNDPNYRQNFESTPGSDFFGHMTPQFKFALLSRIALSEGLTNQTDVELMSNKKLVAKAIQWLSEVALFKKARREISLQNQTTETHFTYHLSPKFKDERNDLYERGADGKLVNEGQVYFQPLAGISSMDAATVPEFVRYQEPNLTQEEILKIIQASLSKKTQAQLIGGDAVLAELLLKVANAKLIVRGTADPSYAKRLGKTYIAQITFPELPDVLIPVKIRVAKKQTKSQS